MRTEPFPRFHNVKTANHWDKPLTMESRTLKLVNQVMIVISEAKTLDTTILIKAGKRQAAAGRARLMAMVISSPSLGLRQSLLGIETGMIWNEYPFLVGFLALVITKNHVNPPTDGDDMTIANLVPTRQLEPECWGVEIIYFGNRLLVKCVARVLASLYSFSAMSTNIPPNTSISSKSQPQTVAKSKTNWLGPALLMVRGATASAEVVPFPYVKGVFATITTVLEAVEKVRKNRDVLKELCEDITEITSVVRDKLSQDPNKVAGELEERCKELDSILQDVLITIQKMQKTRYFLKEMFTATEIADEIAGYQAKIKKLVSNFMVDLLNLTRNGNSNQTISL
ncbi:hypothetical protein GGX14DRAFT_662587 [Mycena pura]|uniref:Uncharacterized protein n=1 Tax=Mycena pura TaxID=153505 RepID=A0AAD6YKB5_9AGAR|nr:hypothetical protein GGX14DRAFT_662587 [Mycena pura]